MAGRDEGHGLVIAHRLGRAFGLGMLMGQAIGQIEDKGLGRAELRPIEARRLAAVQHHPAIAGRHASVGRGRREGRTVRVLINDAPTVRRKGAAPVPRQQRQGDRTLAIDLEKPSPGCRRRALPLARRTGRSSRPRARTAKIGPAGDDGEQGQTDHHPLLGRLGREPVDVAEIEFGQFHPTLPRRGARTRP